MINFFLVVLLLSSLSFILSITIRPDVNLKTRSAGSGLTYPFVKTVHLVYMTHLDIGFTNLASEVCNLYFNEHFINAIKTAETLKLNNRPEEFIYTSHPWLIQEFLDGQAGCTPGEVRNSSMISLLSSAISKGWITWHAHSFSMFTDLLDQNLFTQSLQLSKMLDLRFNKSSKTAASQKDTMGHSSSSIPLFNQAGINALHIGANMFCKAPSVPPVFVWRHEETNSELLVFLYNRPTGATPCTSSFCVYGGDVVIPGFEDVLVYDFTLDNSSPRTADEVIQLWSSIRERYPSAKIIPSSLDAFANKVNTIRDQLPVITDDIGDTWIYGTGADPYKTSLLRAISRKISKLDPQDPDVFNYMRRLLKNPEHNWGLSTSGYLKPEDYSGNWNKTQFQINRNNSDFQMLEAGWSESRSFLEPYNVSSPDSPVITLYKEALSEIQVQFPDVHSLIQVQLPPIEKRAGQNISFVSSLYTIEFDLSTGGIICLLDNFSGRNWANSSNALGVYTYQTYDAYDYRQFNYDYNPGCGVNGCSDFSKPGLLPSESVSREWPILISNIWRSSDNLTIVLLLNNVAESMTDYGAPGKVWIKYTFPESVDSSISIELSWSDKSASRLPEAQWFSFNPASLPFQQKNLECFWNFELQGSIINPFNFVNDGSRRLHAIGEYLYFNQSSPQFNSLNPLISVTSHDAFLVSFGDLKHLLTFDNSFPDCNGGVFFNLHNNLWGTAFPQWYEEDASFRFDVTFSSNVQVSTL